ncbi:MAG: glycosyl hydrolase family 65 protein [Cyanobacteria bacterium J06649_5]
MGGSWMAMVYGFGGLRDYNGKISFSPRLPVELNRLAFSVTVRQQLLKVELLRNKATYCLQAGTALVITHEDKEISLTPGIPVAIEMS